jgi:hypothetical protein
MTLFITGMVFAFATIIMVIVSFSRYRQYLKILRKEHKDKLLSLKLKDEVGTLMGDWYRWPIGSSWIIIYAFDLSDYCMDNNLLLAKRNFRNSFIYAITAFIAAFIFFYIGSRS